MVKEGVNILHVLNTPRAEGTPNLVLDWLSVGSQMNLRQSVVVLNSTPTDLTDRLRDAAERYVEHDLFSCGRKKFPLISRAVYRAARESAADLVVCWPTGFANWACVGARLAGVKRLLVHSGNPATRGLRADWMARYCFWPLQAINARVICCSDYVRDQVRAIPLIRKSMFHTVWNCARVSGVSERAAAARSSRREDSLASRPTIIMVATFEDHKDHPILIRALPHLIEDYPDLRLILVGDGSRRPELERLAQQAGVAHAVDFMGTRMDVPELLGVADAFVFATTPREGLGTVLIEALAAGLPVVASDVPACRELLQNGARGSLVPANNPIALAEAVSATLRSAGTNSGQRTSGQNFARSFTPQKMISEYLKLVGIEVPHA